MTVELAIDSERVVVSISTTVWKRFEVGNVKIVAVVALENQTWRAEFLRRTSTWIVRHVLLFSDNALLYSVRSTSRSIDSRNPVLETRNPCHGGSRFWAQTGFVDSASLDETEDKMECVD